MVVFRAQTQQNSEHIHPPTADWKDAQNDFLCIASNLKTLSEPQEKCLSVTDWALTLK